MLQICILKRDEGLLLKRSESVVASLLILSILHFPLCATDVRLVFSALFGSLCTWQQLYMHKWTCNPAPHGAFGTGSGSAQTGTGIFLFVFKTQSQAVNNNLYYILFVHFPLKLLLSCFFACSGYISNLTFIFYMLWCEWAFVLWDGAMSMAEWGVTRRWNGL